MMGLSLKSDSAPELVDLEAMLASVQRQIQEEIENTELSEAPANRRPVMPPNAHGQGNSAENISNHRAYQQDNVMNARAPRPVSSASVTSVASGRHPLSKTISTDNLKSDYTNEYCDVASVSSNQQRSSALLPLSGNFVQNVHSKMDTNKAGSVGNLQTPVASWTLPRQKKEGYEAQTETTSEESAGRQRKSIDSVPESWKNYWACEQSISSARASVMVYDDTLKKWVPSGSSSGLSKVHIYHHTQHNTFRVVGRKLNDHEVVINCGIVRGLKYNQATATFHQWRDSRQVYGLNFSCREDADSFARAMMHSLEVLANKTGGNPVPVPQPALNGHHPPGVHYEEDMGYRSMTREDAAIIQQHHHQQQQQQIINNQQQQLPPQPQNNMMNSQQQQNIYQQQQQQNIYQQQQQVVNQMASMGLNPQQQQQSPMIPQPPPHAPHAMQMQQQPNAHNTHHRTSSAPMSGGMSLPPAPPPVPPHQNLMTHNSPAPPPPTPPAPPPIQGSAPPPPPCPPIAGGGGPPPPPPPPSAGISAAPVATSLAAQLQHARLRKAFASPGGGPQTQPPSQQPQENSGSSTSSGGSSAGGKATTPTPMHSMMNEMAQTLARRRAQVDKSEEGGNDSMKNWEKSATLPHRLGSNGSVLNNGTISNNNTPNSNGNTPSGGAGSGGVDSLDAKARRRMASASEETILKVNGSGDMCVSPAEWEAFKQELLREVKVQVSSMKQEIIDAIKMELTRR